jgi:S-layer homology domain
MNINSFGFSTPRALALGTVAVTIALGVVSGAFSTFYTTIQSGQSCSGYGMVAGYGYGYNCTPIVSTTGGGGGGSSSPVVVIATTTSGTTVTPTVPVTPVTPTTPKSAIVFSDFQANCIDEVKDLTDSRLTPYYGALGVTNKGNTERRLTRAEFLKLVLNSAGVDVSTESAPTAYSDVSAAHSLNRYIAYATRAGIVSGSNGTFRPDAIINRAEAAKILVRGTGIGLSTTIATFSDVSASASLAGYIQTAYDNCILHGRHTMGGDTTVNTRVFEPADGITLAETIKVLYNINN